MQIINGFIVTNSHIKYCINFRLNRNNALFKVGWQVCRRINIAIGYGKASCNKSDIPAG